MTQTVPLPMPSAPAFRLGAQPYRPGLLSLQLCENAVGAAEVAELNALVRAQPSLPSGVFWIPASEVRAFHAGDRAPVERLAAYFGHRHAELLFAHFERVVGALPLGWENEFECLELWTMVVPTGKRTVWAHVDTCSGAEDWRTAAPSPLWGSILYLSPFEAAFGDTVFCTQDPPPESLLDQCMYDAQEADVLAAATEWQRVAPKPGRLVLFRGSLAHFVSPSTPEAQGPRVTLLVNVWHAQPPFPERWEGLARITPEELQAFARLPRPLVKAMLDGELEVPPALVEQADPADLETVFAALARLA